MNPNIPAQLIEESCLLMEDMLILATCIHKSRTKENPTSLI